MIFDLLTNVPKSSKNRNFAYKVKRYWEINSQYLYCFYYFTNYPFLNF